MLLKNKLNIPVKTEYDGGIPSTEGIPFSKVINYYLTLGFVFQLAITLHELVRHRTMTIAFEQGDQSKEAFFQHLATHYKLV